MFFIDIDYFEDKLLHIYVEIRRVKIKKKIEKGIEGG
jgi:hypothetical protein